VRAHDGAITALFALDGLLLTASDDRTVAVWNGEACAFDLISVSFLFFLLMFSV
jgi:hypothetical protein